MKKIILAIFMFTLLLTTFANAFGVTTFYYEGRPLILNPGQIADVELILQNEKTSDPLNVKAEISTGLNIAEITGKTIFPLNSGENNVPVRVKVSIPETSKIGDEYKVGLTFTTAAKKSGQMLEIGTQISKEIPIVVGRVIEPKKSLSDIIPLETLGGIAVIFVLTIVIMSIMKRSKKTKGKKKKR